MYCSFISFELDRSCKNRQSKAFGVSVFCETIELSITLLPDKMYHEGASRNVQKVRSPIVVVDWSS